MADVLGYPDFEFVTIPHPIASLTPTEIETTVRQAIGDVVRILTSPIGGSAAPDGGAL